MNTYYLCGFPITDELRHYGIDGMHWGERRFQNPDGSLTPEGKLRYYGSSGPRKQAKRTKTKSGSDGVVKTTMKKYTTHVKDTIKKNHPWLMSDEELNDMVNRMKMEKALRDLHKDEKSSKMVNRILRDSGDIALNNARNFGQNFFSTAGRLVAENVFKRKGDGGGKKKDKKDNDGGGNQGNNNQKQKNRGNGNQGGATYYVNTYNDYGSSGDKKNKKKA